MENIRQNGRISPVQSVTVLRDSLIERHHTVVDDFRWRSREISRIEGFSDAVFGFAVTLLIVSLEVPKTSTELFAAMHGFAGFVLTFMMLAGMWYAQFIFFRRYGLEDRVTVILNLVLLFTVLFFVYPLKFLMGVIVTGSMMKSATIPPAHRPWIFAIFGIGMAAVFTVFVLPYRHAYRKREELGRNEFEVYETLTACANSSSPSRSQPHTSASRWCSRCLIGRSTNGR